MTQKQETPAGGAAGVSRENFGGHSLISLSWADLLAQFPILAKHCGPDWLANLATHCGGWP